MKNSKYTAIFIVVFILIFVGAFVLVIVNAIRRREISFEGTVLDKNVIEQRVNNNMVGNRENAVMIGGGNMSGGVTHEYIIRVKTEAGKEIKYKISEGMYEIVKIGDRVSKPKGTTEITILSSGGQSAQPPSTSQNPPIPPVEQTPPIPPVQNSNPQSFA